jgi:hypothetical protein
VESLHGLDGDSGTELQFLTFFLQIQSDVKTSKERSLQPGLSTISITTASVQERKGAIRKRK